MTTVWSCSRHLNTALVLHHYFPKRQVDACLGACVVCGQGVLPVLLRGARHDQQGPGPAWSTRQA